MKKLYKMIGYMICMIISLQMLGCISVYADSSSVGNYKGLFNYTIKNKEVYITQINKNIEKLSIPSKIDGYPVKYISDEACKDNSYLIELSLPNTIKKIGKEAFSGTSIINVNIPSSVTEIGEKAFYLSYHRWRPEGVTLNEGLLYIGEGAFTNRFGKMTSITIPASVRNIKKDALYDAGLKSIYIMGMETEFEEDAFYNSYFAAETATIYAYEGSNAEKCAKKFGYPFKSLGKFTGAQKSGNRVFGYEKSKKVTGLKKLDGKMYFFDSSKGNCAKTGFLTMKNGDIYYFSKKSKNYGQAITGWLKSNNKKYYFQTSGDDKYKAAKGWMKIKGEKYYFYNDGTMAIGKVKINNKTYTFDKNGKLV